MKSLRLRGGAQTYFIGKLIHSELLNRENRYKN
jgi:hypothetical protein